MLPIGVHLICTYCFQRGRFHITHFLKLVAAALAATVLALGPFLSQHNGFNQLVQIFTRLFPFGRGLVHTYWAPNIWALYSFTDRIWLRVCSNFSFGGILTSICELSPGYDPLASSTSGVLGSGMAFLPSVDAATCLALMALSMIPALVVVVKRANPYVLVDAVTYCSLCSFMLGYHVHEKAILIPMIVSTLSLASEAAVKQSDDWIYYLKSSLTVVLSLSGVHGIFPLFSGGQECVIKIFLMASYVTANLFATRLIPVADSEANRNRY